ncbi:MAG: hypothetical protein AB1555_03815 [Nitrospirota bacterium]
MARISDAERIMRLLESAGGSLGRREIIEALGLSDERYTQVIEKLVDKKDAVKNRGRAGGLRLSATGREPEAIRRRPGATDTSTLPLEKEYYRPFAQYLRTAAESDNSKSLVLNTHKTKAGKWETPDLAEVRITPFPMVGQWELRVAVYELKREGSWNVESVLQAATYNEFAHESWLVVPAGDDGDWVEYFGKRVVDKAGDLGIGLGTFDATEHTLKKHMRPQWRQLPSLSRQQEWLEDVIERLGEEKLKEDIAGYIRWARSKAESGRD